MKTVKFSSANSKLKKMARELGIPIAHVRSFNLPAGHTCPCADICKAWVDRETNVTHHGKNMLFECFAVRPERQYKDTKALRWHNFDTIKSCKSVLEIMQALENSLPKRAKIIRIHCSGDFFSKRYFEAWVKVTENHPEIFFYGYTKVLPYVKAQKPDNFKLTYSQGGKMDALQTDEPYCKVVKNKAEALQYSIPVCCQALEDDIHAIKHGISFALVEH